MNTDKLINEENGKALVLHDVISRLERRINKLANEISKQFNITAKTALEEIERVRTKHPNIKKSRKILKKLENIGSYCSCI